MPELPEVETTRRGLEPAVIGRRLNRVEIKQPRLRWQIPMYLPQTLQGRVIKSLKRRGKYLLFEIDHGTLVVHLGMSGSLRLEPRSMVNCRRPHDHVIFEFEDGDCLVFHDPRRFGAVLWTTLPIQSHPLLRNLGPEPLESDFDGHRLYRASRGHSQAVKNFIMDQKVVVGVGNIYANEALFCAGIHPARAAGRVSEKRYLRLANCIRQVLQDAIARGGSTLRDFVNGQGQPGYFQLTLNVYGREGKPCPRCGTAIKKIRLGQRATYFCPSCQH